MGDFLKRNRIDLFNDNEISFGNLKVQYDREIARLISIEKYEEAAKLKKEAIAKGVKINL